jgi:hypothetical protein
MKHFLAVLILLVAVVVGLGLYRGWWSLASNSTDTKVHLDVTVDKDRIQKDKKNALEEVQDFGHQMKDKTSAPTEESTDNAAHMQPPQSQR